MSDHDAPRPSYQGQAILIGDEYDVHTEKVAHGGHMIARVGEVVAFVRGALPGESVRIRITDVRAHFVRAETIDVHRPHPQRRIPLCAVAGECGGCDFQYAPESLQRQMKLSVLHEALVRQGKLAPQQVEALLRDGVIELGPGTGWRTRMRYRIAPHSQPESGGSRESRGVLGMYRHRSDVLVDATSCVIADAPGHRLANKMARDLPLGSEIVMATGADGPVVMIEGGERQPDKSGVRHQIQISDHFVDFHLPADAFWQVHPALSQAIIDRLLDVARPRAGEHWWDLYAGAGPIAAALAICVTKRGRVDAVESSGVAVERGREALSDFPWVSWHHEDVRRWLAAQAAFRSRSSSRGRRVQDVQGVVLDPPRSGAGASVLRSIARMAPRIIVMVACDPVALGRDTALLGELGYGISTIRVWDAFPQTHHMETFATFQPRDQIS